MTHYPAFNAPCANDAYDGAPDLDQEAEEVARLVKELDGPHRPEYYGPVTTAERREVILRLAAVHDRRWWRSRTEADGQLAESAAFALQQFDRLHPEEVAGPIGPDSIEWDAPGGTRAYVRSEYWTWRNVPPGCGPCDPHDPCEWHQR
ncbi:hypothetical protein ACIQWA_40550 [Kitasatospora sp. NPDC098652]|uniref:hypothetical protein n=1 Tax=Kitasatospora sp. NPDC098652 TaxID=3364095 RepID=UPI00382052FA